jgi:AcrR family transcriptional regulator
MANPTKPMNLATTSRERRIPKAATATRRAQEGGIGLFAHFRSKEDVQIELLTHLAGFALERIVRPSMTAAEGLPRLRALLRNWFGWAPRAGLPGGCPVAAGLFEFDDVEGRVREQDPGTGRRVSRPADRTSAARRRAWPSA